MSHPSSKTESVEIIDILRIAPGGEGVGRRAEGEVIFVPATAPGDQVEILVGSRTQGVLRGQLMRVISPSPDRRDPACPYASQCGGCDFMHLRPAAQRREKLAILEDALGRVGGNPPRPASIRVRSSPNELGYRSRLRLHLDSAGNVGMLSLGTHRVVPITRCLVAEDPINAALLLLSGAKSADKKRLSYCEQIELRSGTKAPELAVRLFPRKGAQLRAELYAPLFPAGSVVVVAGSRADDEATLPMPVTADVTLRIPLSSFSQAHRAVNQQLVEAVVEAATLRARRTFLDAYAGAGNFAIPLLRAGLTGEAIDSAPAGILAARAVARDLGLPFAGFNVGHAGRMLEHFARLRRQFDYIVLDPPRQGAKSVLEAALRLKPRTLALVGCDPVALARDLGQVTGLGGRIESLTLFDMFPETHHSETLAIVDCDG